MQEFFRLGFLFDRPLHRNNVWTQYGYHEGFMKYQRFLAPGFKPFNSLELARETEQIVTRPGFEGLERKYTSFHSVPVYRGIATGYAVGCCLRCIYCWLNWSRDFPERFGYYHSPREASRRLFKAAEEGISYSKRWKNIMPKVKSSGSPGASRP